MKKWKFWEPFWSYQLNSTANPAHLPKNWAQKWLPGFSFFSIVVGAKNLSYVKYIATFWVHYFSLSQCAWTFAKSTKLPPISENDPNKLSIRHRNSYVTRCASTICYLHAKFLMQSKGEASCVCERNFDQNSWRIPLLSISLL